MVDHSRMAVISRYWRGSVVGTVDHVEVNERIHDDAGWNARYLFMTTMSAGIAVLGLLLSSPAVVIGAMLISPLMGPIIGLGFALATVDAQQIRRAGIALFAGAGFAIAFCAAIVLVSPLQNVTSEIAARTRPNLFDLLVALFSALAGSYATIRGRHGTIVGVAIATALMPPLATVGFGLATWNGTVFAGALLLFVTNFVTIALTAAIMARLYGFGPKLSPNQTLMQLTLVFVTVAVLAVPLGISLRRLAWEGFASSTARQTVRDLFGDTARIDQVDVDFRSDPIAISAVVFTPDYRGDANRQATRKLGEALGRRVRVALRQYRVGTESGDAAAAALRASADTPAIDAAANAVMDQVTLISGAKRDDVLADRVSHRVRTTAVPLPGAPLATYRALEARNAADGWQVEIVPPPVAPPPIPFVDGQPEAAALDTVAWGSKRLGYAVGIAASDAQYVTVSAALRARGIVTERIPGDGPRGGAGTRWIAQTD